MANTWVLLSAIKKVGTEPRKLLKELTTGSFSTPYWTEPLKVQPDGRQLMVRPDRRGGDEEAEWVLVSDEVPIDEHQRDTLLERFQARLTEVPDAEADDLGDEEEELEPDPDPDEDDL
jgi:hypothetical protein